MTPPQTHRREKRPVFHRHDSYRRYMKAVERRATPPAGHYPIGYALTAAEARRALARRFPDSQSVREPGEPREHDDAFVFDLDPHA